MKKENLISKEELKNVFGGNPPEEDGGPGPKVIACQGKALHADCHWEYNNRLIYGRCVSYMAQEMHCSDLL